MAKTAIPYCRRVQDESRIACAKCHGVEVVLGTHSY